MTTKRITKKYLPPAYRKNQTYHIDELGVITRQDGKVMKPQESPNGFGHPVVMQRNAWKLAAIIHKVPNPNNYKRIVEVDGRLVWLSEEKYHQAVALVNGRVNPKTPLTQDKKEYILDRYGKDSITDIAKAINISRMTIYRFLKEQKCQ